MSEKVTVVPVLDQAQFDEAAKIRITVFVEEQHFAAEGELDERDAHCLHLLARDATGLAVGTLRFDVPKSRIGRLAVSKPARGRSIGRVLMLELERLLTSGQAGLTTLDGSPLPVRDKWSILCHAETYALPFYSKLGYEVFGEPDEEDGIPHVWMRKTVESRLSPQEA